MNVHPIRPSRRYSVEMAKHIIKVFSPSDKHTILVFRTERYSDKASYATGDMKQEVQLSQKDCAMLRVNEYNSQGQTLTPEP